MMSDLSAGAAHCELADLATQVAYAAVDGIMEADSFSDGIKEGATCTSFPSESAECRSLAKSPTVAAKSPVQSLMEKMPTPARSPKSASMLPGDAPPHSQIVVNRFGMRDVSAAPQQAVAPPKGGYREWLQARGKQAMERSQQIAPSSGSPNWASTPTAAAAAAPAPPAPAPQALPPQQLASQAPSPVVSWGLPNDLQMQQPWYNSAGMEMSPMNCQAQMAYNGCDLQAPMVPLPPMMPDSSGFGSYHQAGATPMNGQQSPMSFGQQTPMGFSACQQGFTTPMGSQQSQMSFHMSTPIAAASPVGGQMMPNGCSQEEFMLAHMMSGAFTGLDGEQMAHQLRAAAPEVYDD